MENSDHSTISFLAFGDIFGRTGRDAWKAALPELRETYHPDFIIANAENLAHGRGVTKRTAAEMFDAGANVLTSGNHIWDNKEVHEIFQKADVPLVRPLNYPPHVPGKGYAIISVGVYQILVINVLGRVFMDGELDDPFRAIDKLLTELQTTYKFAAIIVDVHAEATSEKIALGHYVDGRVSCVFGTHTHVQTADEKILAHGTAYISDLGMSGARDSVIGVDKKVVIKKFLDQLPVKFPVAEGHADVSGIYVRVNTENGKAEHIERFQRLVKQ